MEMPQTVREIPGMSRVDTIHAAPVQHRLKPGEVEKLFSREGTFLGTEFRIALISPGFWSRVLDGFMGGYSTPELFLKATRTLNSYRLDTFRSGCEVVRTAGRQSLASIDDILDIFLRPPAERDRILNRNKGANVIPFQPPDGSYPFCIDIRVYQNHLMFCLAHRRCETGSRVILSNRCQADLSGLGPALF